MGRKDLIGEVGRIVVKIGTSSITRGGDTASAEFMDSVAEQVSKLMGMGKEVLIVTSGAIGLGLKAMGVKAKHNEIPIRQAAASVGQSKLMQIWNRSFDKFGVVTAQILITLEDYSVRDTVLNLNNTLDTLLENHAVPIFNENDAICVKEIGAVFGDNDTLSAVVASRVDADLLVILSDVEGLYDSDPNVNKDAKLIPTVTDITEGIVAMAGDTQGTLGTGGMRTKIKAAGICKDAGCSMIIASSSEPNVIFRSVMGEEIGTVFVSDNAISKKRRWLKMVHAVGTLEVDEGAMKALISHKSLLPVGVRNVDGIFGKGDVVNIVCDGKVVARGISEYGSAEISKIKGVHSAKIPVVLGHDGHADIVLSENIALL